MIRLVMWNISGARWEPRDCVSGQHKAKQPGLVTRGGGTDKG